MIAIAAMYGLAAAAASGAVIAAGWRSRQRGNPSGCGVPEDPLWGEAESGPGHGPEAGAEVWGAIQRALTQVAPLMASFAVKVEVAAPFGLRGRMDGAVLSELLAQVLTSCVPGAPGGRLLLTATHRGDCIHITITDDRPGADPAGVRRLTESARRYGGALDVAVRPEAGTTVTLRFAAAERSRATEHPDEEPPEAAMGARPPWVPVPGGTEPPAGG